MPSPEQQQTRREFERMVRSRDYATIEEVARSRGLVQLAEEVESLESVTLSPRTRSRGLPTRR